MVVELTALEQLPEVHGTVRVMFIAADGQACSMLHPSNGIVHLPSELPIRINH